MVAVVGVGHRVVVSELPTKVTHGKYAPRDDAMMSEAKIDVLAFTALPRTHWQKV